MVIIPAIDLQAGRCVRLVQGDFDRVTVYGDNPAQMAALWESQGARRIHLVDLDGSKAGKPQNLDAIDAILAAVTVPVDVGGGIRDMDTVSLYLDRGVRWVVLGTAALRNESFVLRACQTYPGRILLGIDARDGRVAVDGWTRETSVTALDLAHRYEDEGIAEIIYTDIARDGMRTGVNVDATRTLAKALKVPVIASGGVSGMADIEALLAAENDGIGGVVVGRAIYDGSLNLAEAIARTQ